MWRRKNTKILVGLSSEYILIIYKYLTIPLRLGFFMYVNSLNSHEMADSQLHMVIKNIGVFVT